MHSEMKVEHKSGRKNSRKWLTAAFLTLPLIANAGPGADRKSMEEYMDKRMDRMQSHLELSDAQVEEVRGAFKQHHQKMVSLHESMQEQMKDILNPEQQQKFEAMHEERMGMMYGKGEKGSHGHNRTDGKQNNEHGMHHN